MQIYISLLYIVNKNVCSIRNWNISEVNELKKQIFLKQNANDYIFLKQNANDKHNNGNFNDGSTM